MWPFLMKAATSSWDGCSLQPLSSLYHSRHRCVSPKLQSLPSLSESITVVHSSCSTMPFLKLPGPFRYCHFTSCVQWPLPLFFSALKPLREPYQLISDLDYGAGIMKIYRGNSAAAEWAATDEAAFCLLSAYSCF